MDMPNCANIAAPSDRFRCAQTLSRRYRCTPKTRPLVGRLFGVTGCFSVKRPNFLVIVADDLGFSDIGAF
ncbi:MAG TPA: hypothetical protein VKA66_21905, partial [Mycobacterium sp.]|nr:hypothetical protein [Mycobacterium sp.]